MLHVQGSCGAPYMTPYSVTRHRGSTCLMILHIKSQNPQQIWLLGLMTQWLQVPMQYIRRPKRKDIGTNLTFRYIPYPKGPRTQIEGMYPKP